MTEPYYSDDSVTLYHGDALTVLQQIPDASIDAVVTDPPYGLEFMGREWDSFKPAASRLRARVDQRTNPAEGKSTTTTPEAYVAGMPYQRWCEAWAAEVLRVLKPGGHLLAFGGTRTVHRLTCAIEDAGFEIRDGIDWVYASGFPKSLDVSKAIDKAAGAEREVVGSSPFAARKPNGSAGVASVGLSATPGADVTAPATDDARRWSGWGTALKPAREPVVWAQKPLNLVPLDWRLVADVHHALAGLLWLSLSPAKRAEAGSPSRNPEPHGAWCVSARVSAALATSPDGFDLTGTYSSPALASTCSNIARSWNAILAALSAPTSTSTTSTASSTTTALRTLNSLLAPITSPITMPACGCPLDGPSSAAPSAANGSSDAWSSWTDTLSRSVPATATEGIALAASSALASIAADLSSDPAAASSAAPTATTGAAASCSPAREPIVLARKPLQGTVAANVQAYGTGALNIDATRVGPGGQLRWAKPRNMGYQGDIDYSTGGEAEATANELGRWPANLVLSHAPDCSGECVPGCPVAELDAQGGVQRDGVAVRRNGVREGTFGTMGRFAEGAADVGYGGEGGASRFFPVFRYEPKAPTSERPRVKMAGASGRVAGPPARCDRRCNICGNQTVPAGGRPWPACGHDDWTAFETEQRAGEVVAHPTVKPLQLMRWLVRLVTPPGGTVLDPFAGSGTTGEACAVEGFRCVLVEREADYLPLIVARLSKPLQPVLFGEVA